jgi:hypothetical protein
VKYATIGLFFMLGCQPSVRTATMSQSATPVSSSVFADSALYRAKCKEADSIANLTKIPQKCTPRDQRVEVR